MSSLELVKRHRKQILRMAEKHRAGRVRLFGSCARGRETKKSDIDFLVAMNRTAGLLDRVALAQELEGLLKRTVDVVNEKSLHWYIRDRVNREAIPL